MRSSPVDRPCRPPAPSPAALILAAALGLAGCEGDRPAATPAAPRIVPSDIFARPPSLTLQAGATAQLQVQVNDGAGQPIGGAPVEFVAGSADRIRVSARGAVTALGPAGPARVDIRSGGRTVSVPITVRPGPPSAVRVLEGAGQTGVVGAPLPANLVLQVVDAFGNVLPDAPVRALTEPADATTRPAASVGTDGTRRLEWILGQAAGPQRLRLLAADDMVAAEVAATATAGPPRQLVQVAGTGPGSDGSPRLEVQAVDAFGNPVAGARVLWSVAGETAVAGPAATTTDESGIAGTVVTLPPSDDTATGADPGSGPEVAITVMAALDPPVGAGGEARFQAVVRR